MNPFDLLRPNRAAPPLTPVDASAGDLAAYSPDALLALGADGCVAQANAAAIDLFGKSLEKLQGSKLENLLDEPPAITGSNTKWDGPRAGNGNGGAHTGGRTHRYDARITRSRGDERIVSVVTGPLRISDEEGAALGRSSRSATSARSAAPSRSLPAPSRAIATCSRARTTRS
jgi:PAS domain-containing protein